MVMMVSDCTVSTYIFIHHVFRSDWGLLLPETDWCMCLGTVENNQYVSVVHLAQQICGKFGTTKVW